jgi:arylsulfate sulfotransferase
MKSLLLLILSLTFLPPWSQVVQKISARAESAALATSTVGASQVNSGTITVTGQVPGPTPFIAQIKLGVVPLNSLRTVRFTISPKPGSVTRSVAATYTIDYLQGRGYVDSNTGTVTVPVFGLYSNYSNTVMLTSSFTDGSSQQNSVTVTTPAYADSCGYNSPTVIQQRTNSIDLSYDYALLKSECGNQSPVIVDTDGAVRWVGTANANTFASIFFDNGFYVSSVPPNSSSPTAITRIEWDGTFALLRDYSNMGINSTGHHNIDPGKTGMLVDVNTTDQTESVVIEIDRAGNVLKTWNLADIISAAMIAGGDDPAQFVQPAPNDWFHNNAVAYRKSDDSLVVSSRENFVICIDYQTGAIKWILGDPTKQWYQFPSLRKYALTLAGNTLPPIGQHAVSFTYDDDLLLFDDGAASQNHTPSGAARSYSVPRKYHIDAQNLMATEVWNYANNPTLYSPFCSSVYEDSPLNYLIDYAIIENIPGGQFFAEIMGLNASGAKVFDYRYPTTGCNTTWNAVPIHMENLFFAGTSPAAVSRKLHGSTPYDVYLPLGGAPGIECRSGGNGNAYKIVVSFLNSATFDSVSVTSGVGMVTSVSGYGTSFVTISLSDVTNQQIINVTIFGLDDGQGKRDLVIPMGILVGDADASGSVDGNDVSAVQTHTRERVDGTNYQFDVDATGQIDGNDVSITQGHTRTRLPSSP